MSKQSPLGFMDSGMGGLTVASEVVKILSKEDLVYYGDNLHIPYGAKSMGEVQGYVLTIIDYLVKKHEIKYMVIACNTATIAAMDAAKERYAIPLIGPVTEGAKKAVKSSVNQKIGILATEGTVNSGGYQNAIHELNPDALVVAIGSPKLVPLVEAGEFVGSLVEEAVSEYLEPIIKAGCDSVILGCTHYPFLTETIKKVSDNKLQIIFPGTEIAKEIQNYLKVNDLLNTQHKGQEMCLTSKLANVSEDFLKVGRKILGMELEFEELNLFK